MYVDGDGHFGGTLNVAKTLNVGGDANVAGTLTADRIIVGGKDMNTLSNFSLVKGKNYIDIKFSDNDFHSLSLKAYDD